MLSENIETRRLLGQSLHLSPALPSPLARSVCIDNTTICILPLVPVSPSLPPPFPIHLLHAQTYAYLFFSLPAPPSQTCRNRDCIVFHGRFSVSDPTIRFRRKDKTPPPGHASLLGATASLKFGQGDKRRSRLRRPCSQPPG